MRKPLHAQYRVDNVPILIRPQFYLYGYGLGLLFFCYCLIMRITIRVKVDGEEKLAKNFYTFEV